MAAKSPWALAADMAARTPESRNRYVDFLRMLSILSVVIGHWMMAAPYFENSQPAIGHMLDLAPWSRWLTWLMQVMPVFFFVGGFSNGTSWDAAQRKGKSYASWLSVRLQRLLGPVIPLLIVWAAMAAVAHAEGLSPQMIHVASRTALVPVWFLAVYILVVLLVPLSRAAWKRWGMTTILLPVICAAILDYAYFALDQHGIAWCNYLFVWLAVHQLGYAWLDGRIHGLRHALPIGLFGLGALIALTQLGPYPLSLVGVPSQAVSNTLPPKLPLLALAAAQFGFLLSLEKPARRFLENHRAWTLTVLVNGMIMSIFLWHSTVMVLLIGLVFLFLPAALAYHPGMPAWWAMRPLWILVYSLLTAPVVLLFVTYERGTGATTAEPALWRLLLGCFAACGGLAFLAYGGVGGGGWLGVAWGPLLAVFCGVGVAGFGPVARLARRIRPKRS